MQLEQLPVNEMNCRIEKCRSLMRHFAPDAGGMLLCSRVSIYYLAGTMAWGTLWVPMDGEPVLMVRKGLGRARDESPVRHILPYRSYRDIPALCADAGSPLTPVAAVDKNAFTWTMYDMLTGKLPGVHFVGCDAVLDRAKACKTEWELNKMRAAGSGLGRTLDELLPARMHVGMSELDIARTFLDASWECGNSGILRMNAHGEESYMGCACVGDSANYPTYYNGPMGFWGPHPAVPCMGSPRRIWERNTLLATDLSFSFEGYHADRTQMYWCGGPIPDSIADPQKVCGDILLAVQEKLRPGAKPAELWQLSCAMAERAGYSELFMGSGPDRVKFLGHGVGLTLDGFPAFARGFEEPLQEGMCVAIEPKIAIPGVGMAGVEHTFEVTAQGGKSLTGTETRIIIVE